MKKSLLLISILFIQLSVRAQSIPNPDFENWSTFTYDDAAGWFTSNAYTVPTFSIPTVSPVGGFSGLAARIETFILGADTLTGYVSNSNGDVMLGEGGVPYSDQPTTIEGYYRYELPGDDTALLLVVFKNGGNIISSDLIQIKGTGSELNYVGFSYPLSLASLPDTVLIAASSSNLMSGQGIANGSWIEFDELVFTGPGVTQPIPGGTFDNWINKNLFVPLGWNVFGEGVMQSNDAHSGSSALSLQTIDRGSGPQSSGASTGDFFSGGYPYSQVYDTLYGMYKYITTGLDTAMIGVTTTLFGTSVGGDIMNIYPTSTYTPFSIGFASFVNPDTLRIDIISSITDSAIDGSTLFVDDLQLYSIITSIDKAKEKNSLMFSAYPNPVVEKLTIRYEGELKTIETILYNALGEIIHTSASGQNHFEISLETYPAGYYWLKMISGDKVSVRKIVKQ